MIWKPAGVFTGALRQNTNIHQNSEVPTLKKNQRKKKSSTVAARKHMSSRQGGKQSGKHMHLIQRFSRQNIKLWKIMKYGINDLPLFVGLMRNKSTRHILDSSLKSLNNKKHKYMEFSSAI